MLALHLVSGTELPLRISYYWLFFQIAYTKFNCSKTENEVFVKSVEFFISFDIGFTILVN